MAKDVWRTAISEARPEEISYRGYPLNEVISELDFASAIYLIHRGEIPTPEEATVFNAMLVSLIDHGISPSQAVTRWVAASGSPVQASTAAGILTFGDYHGGAGKQCGELFTKYLETADGAIDEAARALVVDRVEKEKRVPGYGHPEHPNGDPRCPVLFELAHEEDVAGKYVAMAEAVEDALEDVVGDTIRINMDGGTAALLLDLGFRPSFSRPFITMARLPGLIAHYYEEREREQPWREVPGGVTYDGPRDRTIKNDE